MSENTHQNALISQEFLDMGRLRNKEDFDGGLVSEHVYKQMETILDDIESELNKKPCKGCSVDPYFETFERMW